MLSLARPIRAWLLCGLLCIVPGIVLADASGLHSDDFNRCSLDTSLWTLVDPLGGASVSVEGVATNNARMVISVPAGASRDPWIDSNHAVRVMQPAVNSDFEIQAKFDSTVSLGYQMQGLMVEQDASRFLRFDLASDGRGAFMYCATFAPGAVTTRLDKSIANRTPIWLGFKRVGSQWTARYSTNGTTWTNAASFSYSIAVAKAGVYAGNYSDTTAPAFTAKVDYFLNVASPFAGGEDSAPADLPTVLTRSVTGSGTISVNPDQTAYYCGPTVTVTATPASGWQFQNWTGDLTGTNPQQTLSMTVSRTVQANFTQVINPLQISNVAVTPGMNGATVAWNTNNAADSTVAYGLTNAYELGEVHNAANVTSHSVNLTGLTASTTYHYAITSVDTLGQSAGTSDATFKTLSPQAGAVQSDDFNNFNINPWIWTFWDPLQEAVFGITGTNTTNARLQITLPAGTEHIAWTDGINVPWLRQQVANENFDVQAKFEAILSKRYQVEGIIIQESNSKYIRTDFSHNGTAYDFYVGTISGGTFNTVVYKTISGAPPWYLRVVRVGNQWTVYYSTTPSSWTLGANFQYAMTVNGIGPYIGNEGAPAPAFTGMIDYFFNTALPISPEDGLQVSDTLPPNLYSVRTIPDQNSVSVLWNTDEPCICSVAYGTTTSYELGSRPDPSSGQTHAVTIDGLLATTTYNLRITCTDAIGHVGQSGNLVETTGTGPTIDLWYGDTQQFGQIGMPVPRVNILGNASSSNGIYSLHYTLNGGLPVSLNMGPDTMRLGGEGDFNADIPFTQLQPGSNTLAITASDTDGAQTVRTMTVINSSGPVWPLPYSINWSNVTKINDVAQVLDGLWNIENGTVRPVYAEYDRLIAVGNKTWTTYQITVPITVHSLNPEGYAYPSEGPGVGVLLRWPGHANDGGQPLGGIYPLGGLLMFRWMVEYERFEIFGNNGVILAASTTGEKLQLGITYIFKGRVQNVSNRAQYQFKWWRSGQAEPSGWKLTGSQTLTNDPRSGCLLLLAHEADASFGNVLIEP